VQLLINAIAEKSPGIPRMSGLDRAPEEISEK